MSKDEVAATRELTELQKKCLLAFPIYGQHLPTRSIAYRLDGHDRYHTTVKRSAYNVMKGLERQGMVESTIFLGECRWQLTMKGNDARLSLLTPPQAG